MLDGEKASIKFSLNDYKDYQVIFGQTSTGFGSLQLRQSSGSEGQRYYWYNKNSESLGQLNLNKKSFCSVSLNGDKGEVNLDGQTGVFDVSDDNTNMLIFSRQNTSGYEMNGKVYSFGMGTRRSLVPVVRKSDNKPGMLDLANYSNNLFDENYENISANLVYKPIYVGDGTFTLSTDISNSSNKHLFLIGGNVNSGASSGTNGVSITISRTVEAIDGYVTIVYRSSDYTNDPRDCHTMLNKGSTALPYEPYRKSFYTNEGTGEFTAGPEL